jgi:hypothetical protein
MLVFTVLEHLTKEQEKKTAWTLVWTRTLQVKRAMSKVHEDTYKGLQAAFFDEMGSRRLIWTQALWVLMRPQDCLFAPMPLSPTTPPVVKLPQLGTPEYVVPSFCLFITFLCFFKAQTLASGCQDSHGGSISALAGCQDPSLSSTAGGNRHAHITGSRNGSKGIESHSWLLRAGTICILKHARLQAKWMGGKKP